MPLNADQLLAVFPHPVLTKIIGEPNLARITIQQSEHNGNLASIKSNLGDGLTGLMVLSMKPDIFKTIHPDDFEIQQTRAQRLTPQSSRQLPRLPKSQTFIRLTP